MFPFVYPTETLILRYRLVPTPQGVIQGYLGVRYVQEASGSTAITLMPQLPMDGTANLTASGLHFHNSSIKMVVLPTHAEVSLLLGDSDLSCTYVKVGNNSTTTERLSADVPLQTALGELLSCRDQTTIIDGNATDTSTWTS